MSLIVKICGLTRPDDAEHATLLGADWLGLNFWPRSPRYVTQAQALYITRAIPGAITKVGVFVNLDATQVSATAKLLSLDLIQLHGDEDEQYRLAFSDRLLSVLRVKDARDLVAIDKLPDVVLLDSHSLGYGGSGKTCDWSLALRIRDAGKKVILAGGLTPENVASAVRAVRPYGVDVASGVEVSPGIKDRDKMKRFISEAKEALP